MALEYQRLMRENPGYENTVKTIPQKIYSGKSGCTQKGFFFCYELPVKHPDGSWTKNGEGFYRWYFLDSETSSLQNNSGAINEQTHEIWPMIQSEKETPRTLAIGEVDFAAIRKIVDSHINKSYMKAIQAPIGVKPRLVAWMQLV
jgi:hypothetical protein